MRLLSRQDGKLILTQFADRRSRPKYAILSHRWGEQSDEITYDDINDGTGGGKVGYRKLDFCMRQAESDGLAYCWIDSCCIKRADSTELSEAINSMFKWYEEAEKCYVYLHDVSPDGSSFISSSWFTRGWTLQELLAPSIVEFFSSSGTLIGDRHSLLDEIHRTTRIPVEALRGCPLHEISIEERLSWTKRRETSKEEDLAYSLLGIFGVYLPLIYGEGRENAFKRLREAIEKSLPNQKTIISGDRSNDGEAESHCLRAWRLTDPRDDKLRILSSKDPLLDGSCDWIFRDSAFTQWWESDSASILWLHGDPGKGKTMLMMAMTDHISQKSRPGSDFVSFFFCQDTVQELSSAVAVLRGLTFLLAAQYPKLRKHIRDKYEESGDRLFEHPNAIQSMWNTLLNIARDPSVSRLYLLVDALDECDRNLIGSFFSLLNQTPAIVSRKIKWVLSSRNVPHISEQVQVLCGSRDTSLELNSSHVAKAVSSFIDDKVTRLTVQKRYDEVLRNEVRRHLQDTADDTFLWVALACKELEKVPPRKTRRALQQLPPGLEPLYRRMLDQVETVNDQDDRDMCLAILRTVTITYRPLHEEELGHLAGFDEELAADIQTVEELVSLCGSFLTIRNRYVLFLHQSAKDFFVSGAGSHIIGDPKSAHDQLAVRLVSSMTQTLHNDICGLDEPGVLLNEIDSHLIEGRLLRHIEYACCYWGQHITEQHSLTSGLGQLQNFFENRFLNWLEALSLIHRLADAVRTVTVLIETSLQLRSHQQNLTTTIVDARRFILQVRSTIEQAPLQVYSSALIFTPTESIIRRLYQGLLPSWISSLPHVEREWSACIQTIRAPGYAWGKKSIRFSSNGQTMAFSSQDSVTCWDTATGSMNNIFDCSSYNFSSVAFLPSGRVVALIWGGKWGGRSVKLCDVATGSTEFELEPHSGVLSAIDLSRDGQMIASGSNDGTVKLWDLASRSLQHTLEDNPGRVSSVLFSPNGQLILSRRNSGTLKLWKIATGSLILTTMSDSTSYFPEKFSTDNQILACVHEGNEIMLWNTSTGSLHAKMKCSLNHVASIAFLPDGEKLAVGSLEGAVVLFDTITKTELVTFVAHPNEWIMDISFSPSGGTMATGSRDGYVKVWDMAGVMFLNLDQEEEQAAKLIDHVRISLDGRIVRSNQYQGLGEYLSAATGEPLDMDKEEAHFYEIEFKERSETATKNLPFNNKKTARKNLPFNGRKHEDDGYPEPWIFVRGSGSKALPDDTPFDPYDGRWYLPDLWVCSEQQRLLWLPTDYRPRHYAVHGSKLVIACVTGRVIIMDFTIPKTRVGIR